MDDREIDLGTPAGQLFKLAQLVTLDSGKRYSNLDQYPIGSIVSKFAENTNFLLKDLKSDDINPSMPEVMNHDIHQLSLHHYYAYMDPHDYNHPIYNSQNLKLLYQFDKKIIKEPLRQKRY